MLMQFGYRFRRIRKLREAILGSPRLSICVSCESVYIEQLGSHWMDFHEICYLSSFRKSVEEIQVLLKSDKKNRSILCSVTHPSRKSCRLWDNAEICGRHRQATDDNTSIIRRMFSACRIIKITDTYSECVILRCFSMARMVRWPCLIVTFICTCVSCLLILRYHILEWIFLQSFACISCFYLLPQQCFIEMLWDGLCSVSVHNFTSLAVMCS
jgi:hypothetical protein